MADSAIVRRKGLTTRTALSVGVDCPDLDAPVQVRLSLFDDRHLTVKAWGRTADGGLLLILDDDHDEFPVGRSMLGGKDGVRRTATEHLRRGGWPRPGEKPGAHAPDSGSSRAQS